MSHIVFYSSRSETTRLKAGEFHVKVTGGGEIVRNFVTNPLKGHCHEYWSSLLEITMPVNWKLQTSEIIVMPSGTLVLNLKKSG